MAELAMLRADLFGRLDEIDGKVDAIERRLDRWDGAITLVKTAASVLGLSGIALIVGALVKGW